MGWNRRNGNYDPSVMRLGPRESLFGVAPDWFDGFGPGLGNEDNGAAFKAEGGAELIGEKFFVGVGEEFVAIDEKEKRRRSFFDLGRIEKFQAMAHGADRLTAGNGIVQGAIQKGGGDGLLELGGNVADGFEQAVEMKPGLS